MQNYPNYFSHENLNDSSQLNLFSTNKNQSASNVQNASYHPSNQPYYSNYFKEFNYPQNQVFSEAQVRSQKSQNGDQNSNRNLLDKFQKGNDERIEIAKQPFSAQGQQNQILPVVANRPLIEEEISSIDNNSSVLDTAFISSNDLLNNSIREENLAFQERNQQKERNDFADKVMKIISEKRVNVISLVNQVAAKVQKKNPDFDVQLSPDNRNLPPYECKLVYNLENTKIGRGNSKQVAKEDAAKQVLGEFLTVDKYKVERLHIKLYFHENGYPLNDERVPQEEHKYEQNKEFENPKADRLANVGRDHPNTIVLESFDIPKSSVQNIQSSFVNFDEYLSNLDKKSMPDSETLTVLIDLFEQVSDYTKTISSRPIRNVQKNLSAYFEGCSFEMIGSLALGCLSKNELPIEALLIFEKEYNKIVSEQDMVGFYINCLVEARATSQIKYEIQTEVAVEDSGACLYISSRSSAGQLLLKVKIAKNPQFKFEFYNPICRRYTDSFLHVDRIDKRLQECESPHNARKLMKLMRIWRTNMGLVELPTELLDAILVNNLTKKKGETMQVYVIQLLTAIGTQDSAMVELKECAQYYERMYKEIPEQTKRLISAKCYQSVEAIFNGDFNNSGFNF